MTDYSAFKGLNLPGLAAPAPSNVPARVAPYSTLRGTGEEFLYESGLNALMGRPTSLLGDQPDERLAAWEKKNPGMDIATTLGSFLIPYMGQVKLGGLALKGAAKLGVPLAASALKLGKAEGIIKPWLSESAKLAVAEPLKLGAVAALRGPERVPEVALNDVFSQALAPVVTGALKAGFKGIGMLSPWQGANQRLNKLLPNYPVKGTIQDQLGFLYSKIGQNPTVDPWLQSQANLLERNVLAQVPRGGKYVDKLAGGVDKHDFNRLFQLKQDPILSRKQAIISPTTGYASRAEADAALASMGLPKGWGEFVQFPRILSAGEKSAANNITKTIRSGAPQNHAGWHVVEEADSGLFVMFKKIEGDPMRPRKGDKWVALKTSEPNKLIGADVITLAAERNANFATKVRTARLRQNLDTLPEDSFPRMVESFRKTFGNPAVAAARSVEGVLSKIPGAPTAKNALQTLGNLTADQTGAASAAWGFVRDKIVPAQHEFIGKPLAEQVRLTVQSISDIAKAKSTAMLFGKQGLGSNESVYGRWLKPDTPRGLKELVYGLKEEDLPLVQKIWLAGTPIGELPDALSKMGAVPEQFTRLKNFFTTLDTADRKLLDETIALQKAYGLKEFKPKEGHYLIPHMWKGDWRHRVVNEKGGLVAVGSGYNSKEATANALKYAESMGARVDESGPKLADFNKDRDWAATILGRQRKLLDKQARGLGVDPYTFRARQGVSGFIGQETPMSKKELFSALENTITDRYRYMAEQSVKHQVMPDAIEVWHRYGPQTFNALAYRINQQFGIKGPINKAVNVAVDKFLSPVLGRNSADRLVRAYNAAEMQLTLLSYNIAYPVLNAMTFLQTVLPKAAYVLGAEPESLVKVMGYHPHIDPNTNRPRGIMGVFEPLKLAGLAMRDMARPGPELKKVIDRAMDEGVITSGLHENYVGENSSMGKWVGDKLDLGEWYDKIASLPIINPAKKSEEFSRFHALVVGKNLADVLGVRDPEGVYQFAKQFAHRTMYQYTTADRPKAFNGPVGSLFGLFKNWTAHNLSDLALYGGAAVKGEQFAPMLWSLGGTASLAGVGGLPLYGAADGLSRIISDKSLMENLYSWTDGASPEVQDSIYYGLPSLFGVSLQANASAPFANPARDISYLTNFAILERGRRIAKVADYLSGQFSAGMNPLENDQARDLFAYALMPRTLYKLLAQIEGGSLKAASTGQPIVDGISAMDSGLNAMGFTPTKISKAYELQSEIFTKKENLAAAVSNLGEAFFQSWQAKDSATMQQVLETAMLQGVPLPNVMMSAKSRMRASLLPSLEQSLLRDPELLAQAVATGSPTP